MLNQLFGKKKNVPYRSPAVDHLVEDILRKSTIKGRFEPSPVEMEELVDLIQRLCYGGDTPGWSDNFTLQDYIKKLTPYGPPLILPLSLVAVVTWNPNIGTAWQHRRLEIVLGHIIDSYQPASCDIVGKLLDIDDFGEAIKSHLLRIQRYTSKEVLDTTKARLINTLCTLAWPTLDELPDKSMEVTQWADDALNGLSRAPSKLGVTSKYAIEACTRKLGNAKRSVVDGFGCPRLYDR